MSEMLKSLTLNQKTSSDFLLMFSNVTFHLEIVLTNMTFTNQSMIIHVKNLKRQCNVISVENILRRNENHKTLPHKTIFSFFFLVEVASFSQ